MYFEYNVHIILGCLEFYVLNSNFRKSVYSHVVILVYSQQWLWKWIPSMCGNEQLQKKKYYRMLRVVLSTVCGVMICKLLGSK